MTIIPLILIHLGNPCLCTRYLGEAIQPQENFLMNLTRGGTEGNRESQGGIYLRKPRIREANLKKVYHCRVKGRVAKRLVNHVITWMIGQWSHNGPVHVEIDRCFYKHSIYHGWLLNHISHQHNEEKCYNPLDASSRAIKGSRSTSIHMIKSEIDPRTWLSHPLPWHYPISNGEILGTHSSNEEPPWWQKRSLASPIWLLGQIPYSSRRRCVLYRGND